MKNFIFLNMPGQQPFKDLPPFTNMPGQPPYTNMPGQPPYTNMPGQQPRPNRGDRSILQLSWTRLLLSIKGPALISK